MPILKWKRGEQDALRHLKNDQWDDLLPLIELMSISAAPELSMLSAALPAYVEKVGMSSPNQSPKKNRLQSIRCMSAQVLASKLIFFWRSARDCKSMTIIQ